jgi:Flp pilus assembly protein TadB
MSTRFYLFNRCELTGPFTLGQLQSMWRVGSISADAQIAEEGTEGWRAAAELLDTEPAQPQAEPESDLRAGPLMVALGTGVCLVGVLCFFTATPMVAGVLLAIGFLIATVGRLLSTGN